MDAQERIREIEEGLAIYELARLNNDPGAIEVAEDVVRRFTQLENQLRRDGVIPEGWQGLGPQ